jgi:hypothetical protein
VREPVAVVAAQSPGLGQRGITVGHEGLPVKVQMW